MHQAYKLYFNQLDQTTSELLSNIDPSEAESKYQIAIQLAKNQSIEALADAYCHYATFFEEQKQDYAAAEKCYLKAIEAAPKHANILGNYAVFLENQKQDNDEAEKCYLKAIEADPKHARNLGNYALFLKNQKQDYAAAEKCYLQAIEADPKHANNLGNYANFLKNQKQDNDEAEKCYLQAIEADPKHARNLGNYAVFLENQKQDYAAAEKCYLQAIEADSKDAWNLGNFAIFLENQKQDYAAAEKCYLKAVEADPKHANNLGNYAKLLFITGEYQQAVTHLSEAEAQSNLAPELLVECAFYRYAHCAPYDLAPLKKHLLAGARSVDWDLENNVQRAIADNHPQPTLLAALAKVISHDHDIHTLDPFDHWHNIK